MQEMQRPDGSLFQELFTDKQVKDGTAERRRKLLESFGMTFNKLERCGDAQSQAGGESAQDFAADMMVKANQYGLDMFLSPKQLDFLCKLADWDVPKRRAP